MNAKQLTEMKDAANNFEEAYKQLIAQGLIKDSYKPMMSSLIVGVQATIKRAELTL